MRCVVIAVLVACGGAAPPPPAPAAPAEHRYAVPAEVGALVVDDAGFAAFARALRRDAEADLATATNPRFIQDRRFVLALLDALDERWPEAVAEVERVRALETDARTRAMTGLTIRVWADALARGGTPDAFAAALERRVDELPLDLVRDELATLRTMGQVFSPETCKRLVDDAVRVQAGTIGFDDAQGVAFQRYAVKRLVPVGPVIDRVLGARGIAARKE
jgi:hypothetical protein